MSQTIKIAQKGVKDPNQMTLRERKKHWNRILYIQFKQELKQFKNVLNGKDPMTGQPDPNRRIQHPFPADVAARAERVANLYNGLMQESNAIIQQQGEYSRTRRKGRKDMPPGQAMSAAPTEMEDPFAQMKAATAEMEALTKEASWWGSRHLFKFKNMMPWGDKSEKEDAKTRANLLRLAAVFEDKLQKFEDEILTPGKFSVARGFYALNSALQFYLKLSKDFTIYLKSSDFSQAAPSKPAISIAPAVNVPDPSVNLNIINEDIQLMPKFIDIWQAHQNMPLFKSMFEQSSLSQAPSFVDLKPNEVQRLIEDHRIIVEKAKQIAAPDIHGNSIKELIVAKLNNVVASINDPEFKKIAYRTTSRMLKRLLLGLVSQISEKDVIHIKTEIAQHTKSALKTLDEAMNFLEDKEVSPKDIEDEFHEMSKDLYGLIEAMLILGRDYNEKAQSENIDVYTYKNRLRIISTMHIRYMEGYKREMESLIKSYNDSQAQPAKQDSQPAIDPQVVRDNLSELAESGSLDEI